MCYNRLAGYFAGWGLPVFFDTRLPLKEFQMLMTYEQMTARWGETIAAFLLREIEKAADVVSNMNMPPQERLDRAISKQQTTKAQG